VPENDSASVVFQGLANLVIAKDDEGGAYIPIPGVDTLDTLSPIDVANAYWVFIDGPDDVLEYTGLHPASVPVPIAAGRWNMIPYLIASCDPRCADSGRPAANGVYFVRRRAGADVATERLLLVR
jgi:hypothetical protein